MKRGKYLNNYFYYFIFLLLLNTQLYFQLNRSTYVLMLTFIKLLWGRIKVIIVHVSHLHLDLFTWALDRPIDQPSPRHWFKTNLDHVLNHTPTLDSISLWREHYETKSPRKVLGSVDLFCDWCHPANVELARETSSLGLNHEGVTTSENAF